jgi:gluconokinase
VVDVPDAAPVVLGLDVGTTSTKAVAFTTDGRVVASSGAGYPLLEPFPGHAVQRPDDVVDAVLESVRAVVTQLGGRPVAGLSLSTAMHSLLGLSPDDEPLTPIVTWADTRASEQAGRLRAAPGGLALHQRTGTPLHPMSPLPKLLWFHEQEPRLFPRVGHWVGLKEYLLLRLCGALVVDYSVASATGLLNLSTLQWDD